MNTIHQYIKEYPVNKHDRKLIVGTIHPHNHEDFVIPFFYGNRMSLWQILNDAFEGQLGDPITLDTVRNFLKKNKISISDTIVECRRTTLTALDKDLVPTVLNHQLKDDIHDSKITEVYFTSGFGKNNAFRLFYEEILKQTLTAKIRTDRQTVLDRKYFGRPIKLIALYSPAGTANVGLSRSKEYLSVKDQYVDQEHPVKRFKVDYYRSHFS
jgi:hypothetical protein